MPPRTRPTTVLASAISRSTMPALIISSPASMKNGIDISGNELTECIMRCGSIDRSTPVSQQRGERGDAHGERDRQAEQGQHHESGDDGEAHSRTPDSGRRHAGRS